MLTTNGLVYRVMEDVPSIDYRKQAEEIIAEDAIEQLPYVLFKFLGSNPDAVKYLSPSTVSVAGLHLRVPNMAYDVVKLQPDRRAKIEVLAKLKFQQDRDRALLAHNVHELIIRENGNVPEFEKYIGKDGIVRDNVVHSRTPFTREQVLNDLRCREWRG